MSRSLVPIPALAFVVGVLTLCAPAAASDLETAQEHLSAQRWEEAAAAFRSVTRGSSADGAAWLGLGQALYGLERHDEALAALDEAAAQGADPTRTAVYAARAAAAAGRQEIALGWLERLAEQGRPLAGPVGSDPAFATLVDHPRFTAVLERMRPCRSPEHRQFDFWLGTWDVTSTGGGPPGHNEIVALHDGCVLRESYVNGGFSGMSMNYLDGADGRWHQLWVDNQGNVLRLAGGMEGGAMVLSSEPANGTVDRVTWTPNANETVRQHWQRSTDDGKTWSDVFDGTYRRAE